MSLRPPRERGHRLEQRAPERREEVHHARGNGRVDGRHSHRAAAYPAAGVGLALIMLLAALFHLVRSEFGAIVMNAVLGGVAGFVAWGRTKKAPIPPR
jgi:hypothetical protein